MPAARDAFEGRKRTVVGRWWWGRRWWEVAEDGDRGVVFGSPCWCRWLMGSKGLILFLLFVW
ncbi:hypothetical protein Hdeb2414_s0020g00555791 [Helianthus debilis subsp. tardiflorus]